jgi:hypothetical protein
MAQKFGDLFRSASFLRFVRANGEPGTRVVGVADRNAGNEHRGGNLDHTAEAAGGPDDVGYRLRRHPVLDADQKAVALRHGSINCAAQRES